MIPIKIQCDCGQRYSFDIEPVDGAMPYGVACPSCGADGTDAANVIIAQNMQAEAAAPAAPLAIPLAATVAAPAAALAAAPSTGIRLRATTPTATIPRATLAPAASLAPSASHAPSAAPRGPVTNLPPVDRAQIERDAYAKIMWGDAREDVIRYLMLQGISVQEATEIVDPMVKDRMATIRGKSIRKILIGTALMSVPVIAFFIFSSAAFFPIKLFAIAIMIGLYGGYLTLNGVLALVNPKLEPGDIADQ